MKVDTGDNKLQSFDTDYCSPFQMYFYVSLFEPLKGSVVAESSSKKLDVKERCWTKYSIPIQERTRGYWMPSNFSMTLSLAGKMSLYHVVLKLWINFHVQPGSLPCVVWSPLQILHISRSPAICLVCREKAYCSPFVVNFSTCTISVFELETVIKSLHCM